MSVPIRCICIFTHMLWRWQQRFAGTRSPRVCYFKPHFNVRTHRDVTRRVSTFLRTANIATRERNDSGGAHSSSPWTQACTHAQSRFEFGPMWSSFICLRTISNYCLADLFISLLRTLQPRCRKESEKWEKCWHIFCEFRLDSRLHSSVGPLFTSRPRESSSSYLLMVWNVFLCVSTARRAFMNRQRKRTSEQSIRTKTKRALLASNSSQCERMLLKFNL